MKPWFVVFLLLAACSEDKTKIACDQGDPNACDALAKLYAKRVGEICDHADASVCGESRIAIAAKAVALDTPRPADAGAFVMTVTLAQDGIMLVDGEKVTDDSSLLARATDAHVKNPDIRAVIKADSQVQHGTVIHVLDILKQAGIAKIAFGVSPVEKAP